MFRPFKRKRRADDGRYQDRDAKLWRRLVKAARYQVRAPLADPAPLLKAAMACGKAVPPPGHARRDSAFLALSTGSRAYAGLTASVRAEKVRLLGELADAVAAALDTAARPQGPPPRSDIFG